MLKFVPILVLIILSTGCDRGEPEIHLIPQDYIGEVRINFDIDTGRAMEYKGKFRVYTIPNSGTLNTQFSFNDGWIQDWNLKYYYRDSSTMELTELPYLQIEELNRFISKDTNFTIVYMEQGFNSGIAYFVCKLKDCGDLYDEVRNKW